MWMGWGVRGCEGVGGEGGEGDVEVGVWRVM